MENIKYDFLDTQTVFGSCGYLLHSITVFAVKDCALLGLQRLANYFAVSGGLQL